jgi:selenocysteine lyase/cysteine desulfurase
VSGVTVAGCGHAQRRSERAGRAPSGWEAVREQLALRPGLHHFAAFLLATHPRPVREAIERHRQALDADPKTYLYSNEGRLDDAVLAAASKYLGVDKLELALTDSTTMGLATLYRGLRLRAGDEILTTVHDHYATHEAVRLAARRAGARVRYIRLYDAPERAGREEIVARIRQAMRPRTRVVAITWVHSSTGVKLPVSDIARAIGDRALVCVDGVHALAAEPVALNELAVDFLAAGTHKWLMGPRGTGIVWGSVGAWQHADPVIPSFAGTAYGAWLEGRTPPDDPPGPAFTPGGFHSFEHRWALADAFTWHDTLGKEKVSGRIHALATRLKDGLDGTPGVRLRTPRDAELSSGIVCLELERLDAATAVARLRREHRVIASVTPYAVDYLRLGTSLAVDEHDVDAAVRAIATLAR